MTTPTTATPIAGQKPISDRQFAWLQRNCAYFAGCEFIAQRGDYAAMRRWCLLHGLSEGGAEARAQECAMHWYERQLGLRDAREAQR